MHYNKGDYDLGTYLKNPDVFKVSAGHVKTLEGPGLGIEMDEELVRKVAVESRSFNWRNPVWRGEDGSVREW